MTTTAMIPAYAPPVPFDKLPIMTERKQLYVVGFMICPDTQEVLLLEKSHPAFQRGKWNGIGGHIEPGEVPVYAMVREFYEEAGVHTNHYEWEHTATVEGTADEAKVNHKDPYTIFIYRNVVKEFPAFKSMTDEPVSVWPMTEIYTGTDGFDAIPTLPNMRFILPLQFSFTVKFPILFPHVEHH